jgi:hypothetical protein
MTNTAFCGLDRRRVTDDFIISVHALERFQERFPTLWTNDDEVGLLIYEETMDALDAGRVSSVPPLELASNDLDRWTASGKARIVWVPLKTRGYVLIDGSDGCTVATVLVGRATEEARSRLYGRRKRVIPTEGRV